MGSFISAGTLTADFVRFGRNAKLAVLVAMVAFFLGNSLMFIFGAAGAAALSMADISDVMIAQGLLLLCDCGAGAEYLDHSTITHSMRRV